MKPRAMAAAGLLAALCVSAPANAGIYSDDLARCVVKSASETDQVTLARWIFGAMALHDAVRPLASISPREHENLDRAGAALMQRLLLNDCRKETVAGLKYEGNEAIIGSFQVLGQVAMRGLMSDAKVAAGLQGLNAYVDKGQFDAVAKEAGLPLAQ